MRRIFTVTALVAVLGLVVTAPAQAIIHELVASHCNGTEDPFHPSVDPPGQLRDGRSFASALQSTGIYDVAFGVDQGGVLGFDADTQTFGPMPTPAEGEDAISVFVDNERPSAKLGDEFTWFHFTDSGPDGVLHVYVQAYDLDHPAFEHCANLRDAAP